MNWLYDSPCWRAAALMRVIQSWRKVRFLTFRSRYGVDERALDLLLRVPVVAVLPAPVPLRLLEDLAALLLRVDGSLDSRHYLTLSSCFSVL